MSFTRTPERLTRSETGELDLARAHLVALVLAAREVVAASGHDPDQVSCDQAGCGLRDVTDGEVWCHLAHRLDLLDVGIGPDGRTVPVREDRPLQDTLTDFRGALVDSLDAVRACRSIGHAEGRCWFTDPHGRDVCGQVLRVAHRVG